MKTFFNILKSIFKRDKYYLFLLINTKSDLNEYKVFKIKNNNIKENYYKFLLKEALTIGIIINRHYYNIMNYENHIHYNYNLQTYNDKKQEWRKFLNKHNIEWFIKNKCQGKELDLKIIYN